MKASVLELPAYRVESSSKASAIADLKAILLDQIQGSEILNWQFPIDLPLSPDNPWKKLFGIFQDNFYYDQVLDIIQAERVALGDEDLDPAYYMTNE